MLIPPLFEQLPPQLFRPLAGQNGLRYWGLLTRLNEELWGEGVHAPGELVDKLRVVRVIEEHLIHDDPWVDDEGQEPGSSFGVQASNRYIALRESGWLAERGSSAEMPPHAWRVGGIFVWSGYAVRR